MRDRFLNMSLNLVGERVTVTQTDGSVLEGVFHTFTPFSSQSIDTKNIYIIKSCRQIQGPHDVDGKANSGESDGGGGGGGNSDKENRDAEVKRPHAIVTSEGSTVLVPFERVSIVKAAALRLDFANKPGSGAMASDGVPALAPAGALNRPDGDAFRTDTDISGARGPRGSGDLVAAGSAWTSGDAPSSAGALSGGPSSAGTGGSSKNSRADALLGGIEDGPSRVSRSGRWGEARTSHHPTDGGLSGGSSSNAGGSLRGNIGEWDQFSANERLFNVRAEFDENIYTTELDRSTLDRNKVREAERLAREIEGQATDNLHIAEERGHKIEGNFDEEDLYSGVLDKKDGAERPRIEIMKPLNTAVEAEKEPISLPKGENDDSSLSKGVLEEDAVPTDDVKATNKGKGMKKEADAMAATVPVLGPKPRAAPALPKKMNYAAAAAKAHPTPPGLRSAGPMASASRIATGVTKSAAPPPTNAKSEGKKGASVVAEDSEKEAENREDGAVEKEAEPTVVLEQSSSENKEESWEVTEVKITKGVTAMELDKEANGEDDLKVGEEKEKTSGTEKEDLPEVSAAREEPKKDAEKGDAAADTNEEASKPHTEKKKTSSKLNASAKSFAFNPGAKSFTPTFGGGDNASATQAPTPAASVVDPVAASAAAHHAMGMSPVPTGHIPAGQPHYMGYPAQMSQPGIMPMMSAHYAPTPVHYAGMGQPIPGVPQQGQPMSMQPQLGGQEGGGNGGPQEPKQPQQSGQQRIVDQAATDPAGQQVVAASAPQQQQQTAPPMSPFGVPPAGTYYGTAGIAMHHHPHAARGPVPSPHPHAMAGYHHHPHQIVAAPGGHHPQHQGIAIGHGVPGGYHGHHAARPMYSAAPTHVQQHQQPGVGAGAGIGGPPHQMRGASGSVGPHGYHGYPPAGPGGPGSGMYGAGPAGGSYGGPGGGHGHHGHGGGGGNMDDGSGGRGGGTGGRGNSGGGGRGGRGNTRKQSRRNGGRNGGRGYHHHQHHHHNPNNVSGGGGNQNNAQQGSTGGGSFRDTLPDTSTGQVNKEQESKDRNVGPSTDGGTGSS